MRLLDRIAGKAPKGARRSPKWRRVRKEHLARHPACAVCGGVRKLEAHHVVPFHVNPSRELDPMNLVTLCEARSYGVVCHLAFGHLGDYRLTNPDVSEDASAWRLKMARARALVLP